MRIIQPDAAAATDVEGGSGAAALPAAKPAPPFKPDPVVAVLPKPFTPTPVVHSVLKVCDRPFAKPDLAFGGQAGFDRQLSDSLKVGRAVVVDLAEPFDAKEAPPSGLDRWLSEVKGSGGAVSVSPYCASGRGISRWFASIVDHLSGAIYKPARAYDVTLFADATRRRVTQIQFKPRAAATASIAR